MIARDAALNAAHRLAGIWERYGVAENFESLRWKGGHSLISAPESLYGVANFVLKHFGLPAVPEGAPLPEPRFPVEVVPAELGENDIDIETLAENLTGRKSPELASLDEAFPPRLTPEDAVTDPEWKEKLAQLEAFVSPRFR